MSAEVHNHPAEPETPERRHERLVDAVEAVLRQRLPPFASYAADDWVRELAEACLDAIEAGF